MTQVTDSNVDAAGTVALFVPGTRIELIDKALAVSDLVIVDLEDAVPASEKEHTRETLLRVLNSRESPCARLLVRINPATTAEGRRDAEWVTEVPSEVRLMLPKCESPEQMDPLQPRGVVGLIETAAGVQNVDRIAGAQGCIALAWGIEDLLSSCGSRGFADDVGPLRLYHHVQLLVLLAAKAARVAAIDAVSLDIHGGSELVQAARSAASLGFDGKMAIHPRQVPLIRQGFQPPPSHVAWARRVVQAQEDARGGVAVLDGQMIDGPLYARAERILGAAGGE